MNLTHSGEDPSYLYYFVTKREASEALVFAYEVKKTNSKQTFFVN